MYFFGGGQGGVPLKRGLIVDSHGKTGGSI